MLKLMGKKIFGNFTLKISKPVTCETCMLNRLIMEFFRCESRKFHQLGPGVLSLITYFIEGRTDLTQEAIDHLILEECLYQYF